MSRFTTKISPDKNTQEIFDDIVEHGFGQGDPINLFATIGPRPDILKDAWGLVKALLVNGEIPVSVKEMIAISVSRQNECNYCRVVHSATLSAQGIKSGVIESCATDPLTTQLSEPARTIVQFALKAAKQPNTITAQDYESLEDLGLSEQEVVEIVMMSSFVNFINTWAEISGVEIDSYFQ